MIKKATHYNHNNATSKCNSAEWNGPSNGDIKKVQSIGRKHCGQNETNHSGQSGSEVSQSQFPYRNVSSSGFKLICINLSTYGQQVLTPKPFLQLILKCFVGYEKQCFEFEKWQMADRPKSTGI